MFLVFFNFALYKFFFIALVLLLFVLGGCQPARQDEQSSATGGIQQVRNIPIIPFTKGPTDPPESMKGPKALSGKN